MGNVVEGMEKLDVDTGSDPDAFSAVVYASRSAAEHANWLHEGETPKEVAYPEAMGFYGCNPILK
jgi:hypothetical protein